MGNQVAAWLTDYGGGGDELARDRWQKLPNIPEWVKTSADLQEKLALATVWHTNVKWIPGDFDALLERAAYGALGPLCIQSESAAFCPYDGGMDVFIKDDKSRRAIRELLREWASNLESGL